MDFYAFMLNKAGRLFESNSASIADNTLKMYNQNKNDKSLFVETCHFLCYRDEKDFFDILRIIALKLTIKNLIEQLWFV